MWTEVVGKALDTKALQELQKSAARSDGWSYAQVEAALLEGLVKQGLLRKLTPR